MAVHRTEFRTVVLEGSATIYEVAALRETLRDAIAGGEHLHLDLGETGKWDLAGVQLLVSCIHSGQGQGRKVRLLRVPKSCADIAERSGLAGWLDSVTD